MVEAPQSLKHIAPLVDTERQSAEIDESANHACIKTYIAVFDSIDQHGEYFTKDTDFYLDYLDSSPSMYDHSLGGLGNIKFGKTRLTNAVVDDFGLFVETEIKRSEAYEKALKPLIMRGIMGRSIGSSPHLSRRKRETKGVEIKAFPISEDSWTVHPADAQTRFQIKSTDDDKLAIKTLDDLAGYIPAPEHSMKAVFEGLRDQLSRLPAEIRDALREQSAVNAKAAFEIAATDKKLPPTLDPEHRKTVLLDKFKKVLQGESA